MCTFVLFFVPFGATFVSGTDDGTINSKTNSNYTPQTNGVNNTKRINERTNEREIAHIGIKN